MLQPFLQLHAPPVGPKMYITLSLLSSAEGSRRASIPIGSHEYGFEWDTIHTSPCSRLPPWVQLISIGGHEQSRVAPLSTSGQSEMKEARNDRL